MNTTIDAVVMSVQGLQRVERFLFYEVEGVPVNTISSVTLEEIVVERAKLKVAHVINANCKGPLRSVSVKLTVSVTLWVVIKTIDTSRICFNRHEQRLEIEVEYER